ncbi:MAG: DUF6610 family protein [Candidatus Helarchaeota archaeon]
MRIYISHSVGCAGWDMENIFEDTLFRTGCRTSRFKEKDIGKVKMLDWDYLEWKKKPEIIKEKHLDLVKNNKFEVVMSMDLWKDNFNEVIDYTNELKRYCEKVLIPVHYFTPEILEYDLAYPNANWFTGNVFPPKEYRDKIIHILGGSPQSQIKLITTTQKDLFGNDLRFKNVQSIDGNQIFNVSIQAGKYWSPIKPYWRKPKKKMTNEEIFKISVKNLDNEIKRLMKNG